MTEATTTVTTIATPAEGSLTTFDDLFGIAHQLFDQYQTTIFVITGTCKFYVSINIVFNDVVFSNYRMAI